MAVTLVQSLFTGQNKAAGTSLSMTGSKTLTVRNFVFIAHAADTTGSAYSATDNLGNSYPVIEETNNSGNVRTILLGGRVTVGGTVTSVTVNWTTNVTAKAGVCAEFAGVGAFGALGLGNTGTDGNPIYVVSSRIIPVGGLAVGAAGVEDEGVFSAGSANGTPSLSISLVATISTTGGGAGSNITCALLYSLPTAQTTGFSGNAVNDVSADHAGAGAVYHQSTLLYPRCAGNETIRRATFY